MGAVFTMITNVRTVDYFGMSGASRQVSNEVEEAWGHQVIVGKLCKDEEERQIGLFFVFSFGFIC